MIHLDRMGKAENFAGMEWNVELSESLVRLNLQVH